MVQLGKRATSMLVVGVFLWCNAIQPPPCLAATVWSDDFSDGNLDGWTVDIGEFSVFDNTMRGYAVQMSRGYHTSNVVTGTWSYDVRCGERGITIQFISIEMGPILIEYYSYDMTVSGGEEQFFVFRHYNYVPTQLGVYRPPTILGWHHIDITRDGNGQFYVYFNGTLGMQFVDTTYNQSNYFIVQADQHTAIDNIVVSDTIDIQPPTTSSDEPLGIPGFPITAIGIGIVLTVGLVLVQRRLRFRKAGGKSGFI